MSNSPTQSALQSDALDALGNPMRREIVALLAEKSRSVGDLAAVLPVSRPAVSKHLRVLKDAALVSVDVQGTRNVYRLAHEGASGARSWIDNFWGTALQRFALVAENTPEQEPR